MPIALFTLGVSFALLSILLFSQHRKNSAFAGLLFAIVSISLAYWSRPTSMLLHKKCEVIHIDGSKTLGRSLMPRLMEKYLEQHGYTIIGKDRQLDVLRLTGRHPQKSKDLIIEIKAKGSVFGFEQLLNGQADLTMASSRIEPSIMEKLDRQFVLNKHEHIIAYDAVQLIVHPKMAKHINQINSLRLSDLLTARIQDWGELSPTAKGTIHCYLRDEQSGTFHYLENLFLRSAQLRPDAVQLSYFEQIASAVAKDSLGLGFINYAIDPRLLEDIRVLKVFNQEGEAVAASYRNILNGQYPLARPLYLYSSTKQDRNPTVQSIIHFCRATEASDIVHKEGLIPLAEALY